MVKRFQGSQRLYVVPMRTSWSLTTLQLALAAEIMHHETDARQHDRAEVKNAVLCNGCVPLKL